MPASRLQDRQARCTATALRVHVRALSTFSQRCTGHMSSRNVGAVALVVLLGLVIGTLGLVEADLYAVGVLILFLGGVGVAVLAGEYLIRYLSSRQPPA
jgi:TRAP-type mannitol/chloroaromatic compound transport system permease large subunit